MGRHRLLAKPCGQLVGHPLHQAPGVDEHQRGAVLLRHSSDGVEGLSPDFVGGDGPKLLRRQLDGKVDLSFLASVDDQTVGIPFRVDVLVPDQEAGHFLYWLLGGRQPDADDRAVGQGAQPLYREGQVGTALVVGDGVDFVEYDGMNVFQSPAPALGGQQDVQGLGRGNENVRRLLGHPGAFRLLGVAGPHRGADFGKGSPPLLGQGRYLLQRLGQVFLDVVGQRL